VELEHGAAAKSRRPGRARVCAHLAAYIASTMLLVSTGGSPTCCGSTNRAGRCRRHCPWLLCLGNWPAAAASVLLALQVVPWHKPCGYKRTGRHHGENSMTVNVLSLEENGTCIWFEIHCGDIIAQYTWCSNKLLNTHPWRCCDAEGETRELT
jgi:hypothetical protein